MKRLRTHDDIHDDDDGVGNDACPDTSERKHRKRFLERKNEHPRDARIVFDDTNGQHKYTIYSCKGHHKIVGTNDASDKHPFYLSCTTFVATGFEPFNEKQTAAKIVENCTEGSYYFNLTEEDILKGLWPLFRLLGSYMHDRFEAYYNREWRLRDAKQARKQGNALFFWEFYKEFRRFSLQWPHLERFFNNKWHSYQLGQTEEDDTRNSALNPIPPEFNAFSKFVNDHRARLVAYRTEWLIFDEELRLCGAIDIIFYDKKLGAYVIYDWKRSRRFYTSSYGKMGNATWSVDMEDTNVNHYYVQLHVYTLMLQRNYNIWPAQLALVRCHPDGQGSYQKLTYDVDQSFINKLVEARKAMLITK